MRRRRWTHAELRRLDRAARIDLRDDLVAQLADPSETVRQAAAVMLAELARAGGVTASDANPSRRIPRIPPRAPDRRTPAQRADDARAFLDPQQDPATARRIADAKAFLYPQQDSATAQRVADARDFLSPPTDAALTRRVTAARESLGLAGPSDTQAREQWERALALCGDERTARQRGYRKPEGA